MGSSTGEKVATTAARTQCYTGPEDIDLRSKLAKHWYACKELADSGGCVEPDFLEHTAVKNESIPESATKREDAWIPKHASERDVISVLRLVFNVYDFWSRRYVDGVCRSLCQGGDLTRVVAVDSSAFQSISMNESLNERTILTFTPGSLVRFHLVSRGIHQERSPLNYLRVSPHATIQLGQITSIDADPILGSRFSISETDRVQGRIPEWANLLVVETAEPVTVYALIKRSSPAPRFVAQEVIANNDWSSGLHDTTHLIALPDKQTKVTRVMLRGLNQEQVAWHGRGTWVVRALRVSGFTDYSVLEESSLRSDPVHVHAYTGAASHVGLAFSKGRLPSKVMTLIHEIEATAETPSAAQEIFPNLRKRMYGVVSGCVTWSCGSAWRAWPDDQPEYNHPVMENQEMFLVHLPEIPRGEVKVTAPEPVILSVDYIQTINDRPYAVHTEEVTFETAPSALPRPDLLSQANCLRYRGKISNARLKHCFNEGDYKQLREVGIAATHFPFEKIVYGFAAQGFIDLRSTRIQKEIMLDVDLQRPCKGPFLLQFHWNRRRYIHRKLPPPSIQSVQFWNGRLLHEKSFSGFAPLQMSPCSVLMPAPPDCDSTRLLWLSCADCTGHWTEFQNPALYAPMDEEVEVPHVETPNLDEFVCNLQQRDQVVLLPTLREGLARVEIEPTPPSATIRYFSNKNKVLYEYELQFHTFPSTELRQSVNFPLRRPDLLRSASVLQILTEGSVTIWAA